LNAFAAYQNHSLAELFLQSSEGANALQHLLAERLVIDNELSDVWMNGLIPALSVCLNLMYPYLFCYSM
jgi:hypothetical protein